MWEVPANIKKEMFDNIENYIFGIFVLGIDVGILLALYTILIGD